jgi:hypothetical protein
MLSKKSAACRPSAIIESTGGRGVDHAVEVGGAAADTDPFLLHIYAALAEKERALISRRTKDALAAAKARGVVIGGLRDKGRELQAEALDRAEALRPVFCELAGLSPQPKKGDQCQLRSRCPRSR